MHGILGRVRAVAGQAAVLLAVPAVALVWFADDACRALATAAPARVPGAAAVAPAAPADGAQVLRAWADTAHVPALTAAALRQARADAARLQKQIKTLTRQEHRPHLSRLAFALLNQQLRLKKGELAATNREIRKIRTGALTGRQALTSLHRLEKAFHQREAQLHRFQAAERQAHQVSASPFNFSF